ncbi:MAG: hypothetical protein AAF620_00255 [Bacteroidota bacterium]
MPTPEEIEAKLRAKDQEDKEKRSPKTAKKIAESEKKSSGKTAKKTSLVRYINVDYNKKRGTESYHMHPDYAEIILKIQYLKHHRNKGGTLEYLIDFFLNNISETQRKELLKININEDY